MATRLSTPRENADEDAANDCALDDMPARCWFSREGKCGENFCKTKRRFCETIHMYDDVKKTIVS